jgi:hypothetical protein
MIELRGLLRQDITGADAQNASEKEFQGMAVALGGRRDASGVATDEREHHRKQ